MKNKEKPEFAEMEWKRNETKRKFKLHLING